MLGKRSQNKFQGVSRLVPKIYELNIRQNIFSDFSSPRLGVRLMCRGGLYAGFYGNFFGYQSALKKIKDSKCNHRLLKGLIFKKHYLL